MKRPAISLSGNAADDMMRLAKETQRLNPGSRIVGTYPNARLVENPPLDILANRL